MCRRQSECSLKPAPFLNQRTLATGSGMGDRGVGFLCCPGRKTKCPSICVLVAKASGHLTKGTHPACRLSGQNLCKPGVFKARKAGGSSHRPGHCSQHQKPRSASTPSPLPDTLPSLLLLSPDSETSVSSPAGFPERPFPAPVTLPVLVSGDGAVCTVLPR